MPGEESGENEAPLMPGDEGVDVAVPAESDDGPVKTVGKSMDWME